MCHVTVGLQECNAPNPPCRTGPHCLRCDARHCCHAAQMAGTAVVEYLGESIPENLTVAQLGYEATVLRRAEEAIKLRKTGLEAQIESLLHKGELIPGWNLQDVYSKLAWTKDFDEVAAIGDLLGIEVRKQSALITPTQARGCGI